MREGIMPKLAGSLNKVLQNQTMCEHVERATEHASEAAGAYVYTPVYPYPSCVHSAQIITCLPNMSRFAMAF